MHVLLGTSINKISLKPQAQEKAERTQTWPSVSSAANWCCGPDEWCHPPLHAGGNHSRGPLWSCQPKGDVTLVPPLTNLMYQRCKGNSLFLDQQPSPEVSFCLLCMKHHYPKESFAMKSESFFQKARALFPQS